MLEYYTIAVIALLAAISPGPDFIIITKNALSHDRKMAVMTSVGIGLGILVHTSYCVLGLALVISQSLLLFNLIKYLGASYLIYLGIKSLFSKKSKKLSELYLKKIKPTMTLKQALRDGFLTNVLNPKCTLFMLSIFTVVIKPHTPQLTQAFYGIEIAAISTLWFILLSFGLTHRFIKNKINKVQDIVNKMIGFILLALGVFIILEKSK